MPSFYPVTVCRSDGRLDTIMRSGTKEPNEPTPTQQSQIADPDGTFDYYRKIGPEDTKALDWRRKIGGMLMNTLGGKEHADRDYILSEFPDGYKLWEHIKYNPTKTADDKKTKGKHAAGGLERQDAYLYGHPQGRKKRFRSPADFFPHLVWLATDIDGDSRNNCTCKLCYPEGDEADSEVPVKADIPLKKEARPTVSNSKAAPLKLAAPVTVKSKEQESDALPNGKYTYRPGELVWFNNGFNWRLGVISKRGLLNENPRYLIQPLSNPLQIQGPQIRDQESALRPWLAWSVPQTTIETLNNATFEQVPWERVVRGDFDAGKSRDYVVDGSILAAKQVDSSYSLFDRNENALAGPGETHYNGMFLGAEKIWVGEAVRLRTPGADKIILIISKLIERTVPPSTSIVTFVGDVYKFVEMPMPYSNRSEWPTPNLPPRLISDLRFRNEVADNAKRGIWYEWRLLEPNARKGLSEVKGRWYETRTLLPILHTPEKFQESIAMGTTSDVGDWMNGRRDKNGTPEQRRKNRKDTLGRAVPLEFKVSRGLDGSAVDDAFPEQQAPPLQEQHFVETDIDQFMDLDQGDNGQDYFEM